jgi:hypothetical protein
MNKNAVKLGPTHIGGQGSSPSPGGKDFNKVIKDGVKMGRKIYLGFIAIFKVKHKCRVLQVSR